MGTLIPFDILRGFIFGAAALSKGGVDLPKGQYVAMTIAFPFKFPLENDASQGPKNNVSCYLPFCGAVWGWVVAFFNPEKDVGALGTPVRWTLETPAITSSGRPTCLEDRPCSLPDKVLISFNKTSSTFGIFKVLNPPLQYQTGIIPVISRLSCNHCGPKNAFEGTSHSFDFIGHLLVGIPCAACFGRGHAVSTDLKRLISDDSVRWTAVLFRTVWSSVESLGGLPVSVQLYLYRYLSFFFTLEILMFWHVNCKWFWDNWDNRDDYSMDFVRDHPVAVLQLLQSLWCAHFIFSVDRQLAPAW